MANGKPNLMDFSSSYTLYLVLGAASLIVGGLVANLGGWFAADAMGAIGGILAAPGRLLILGGFLAAGLAGDKLPTGVRIASLAVAGVLFARLVVLSGLASKGLGGLF